LAGNKNATCSLATGSLFLCAPASPFYHTRGRLTTFVKILREQR
jgi:hypothetical protein